MSCTHCGDRSPQPCSGGRLKRLAKCWRCWISEHGTTDATSRGPVAMEEDDAAATICGEEEDEDTHVAVPKAIASLWKQMWYEAETAGDVRISTAEGEKLRAHGAFLAAASPALKASLKQTGPTFLSRQELKVDMPTEPVRMLLELLYTGFMPETDLGHSLETLLDAFELCYSWQLLAIAEILEVKLAGLITPENVEMLLSVAVLRRASILRRACLEVVKSSSIEPSTRNSLDTTRIPGGGDREEARNQTASPTKRRARSPSPTKTHHSPRPPSQENNRRTGPGRRPPNWPVRSPRKSKAGANSRNIDDTEIGWPSGPFFHYDGPCRPPEEKTYEILGHPVEAMTPRTLRNNGVWPNVLQQFTGPHRHPEFRDHGAMLRHPE
eukprot:TRINITY_DN51126_c0_g1_i1.p1 TRINITY_DN51126_c0_g1~~TRINITY_DN51126_c0_g1_i1.p1  ORF type:complete len:400 (-),score=68.09 TRINITY_DN51126_c0_g1_i1:50-1195(-)